MKYKLLALDLDGTLTNSKKEISDYTKEVLFRFQENGGRIILASGRPTYGIVPLAEQLNLKEHGGFILSYNGARILDCEKDEIVYDQNLTPEEVQEIYDLSQNFDVNIMSYDKDTVITENEEDPYVQIESKINKMPLKEVECLADYVDYPVNKCLMTADGDYLATVEPQVKEALGDRLSVYRSEAFFLEVMPQNVDKAASLDALLKQLDMSKDQLIACGDGFNDLSMIEYAGLGVAMENGKEVVKESADYIAPSNDEDGVAHVVNKFVFQSA